MSKKIIIRIAPDGQIKAEIMGFKGPKCADYIDALEQMLDAQAIDSETTPEYYLSEVVEDVSHHIPTQIKL